MGVIRILDAVTANQIAAGEVVERPSSVVKELVENAIDAGSTRIEVQIANSGLDYIRITDNGWGMTLQDALLAFERHATSKITTVDDLWTIESLGFRGEALPSIASVAKVELITRPAGSIAAARIEIAGGKVIKVEETGAPQGTSIIVRDLFYNTPARKKHLKSPGTEMGLISEVLTRLALAYPRIAFSLTHNGRKQMQTTGTGQLVDAIISTQGVQSAKAFLPIKAGTEHFVVEGLLGGPELSRGTRGQQVLFVNGRYVRSKLVSQAVEEGYHSRLMIGRFPAFVLNLRVHPGQVDVNVHPTKMEVRFSREGELQQFLVEAIRQALADQMSVPQLKVDGLPKPTLEAKAVAVELVETGLRVEPVPVIQQEIYYPERNIEKNTETHSYPVSPAEHRATGVREGAQADSKAAWAEPA
ncbi:MAG TPA: DNA mismatch repair endonuclease MutL, partial [Bacillota bacterium]|nr:DNA mismatch repair endonuclease MutL [Bacillota bacterium]